MGEGRLISALLAAGLVSLSVLAAQAPAKLTDDLSSLIESQRTKAGIPGLSVAIRRADGSYWSKGFGLADIENDVPATEKTVYRLASISKPIAAVALMQLVGAGKVDLDADVRTYVESFPKKRWVVTTRQLGGHLGGVRHYEGNRAELRSNFHYRDVTAALEIFADDPLIHEPGTQYRYTTYGFNLLGAVVESVEKRHFTSVLQTAVFEPAGMVTMYGDDSRAIIKHRAQGYRMFRGQLQNSNPVDTSNKIPGGGLCSTALDLARFGDAMLTDKLLPRKVRDEMWTSQKTAAGKTTGYGIGFGVKSLAGRRMIGHSGAQPRVSTLLQIFPDQGLVVAIMANLEGRAKANRALAAAIVAIELR